MPLISPLMPVPHVILINYRYLFIYLLLLL